MPRVPRSRRVLGLAMLGLAMLGLLVALFPGKLLERRAALLAKLHSPEAHRVPVRPSAPQEASAQGESALRPVIESGNLSELRWPNFTDYRGDAKQFYENRGYSLAWSREGRPTPQALTVIEVLKGADSKGLNSEDYNGSRWGETLEILQKSPPAAGWERFDLTLTVCVMRYVSDLHIGKVNPRYFHFGLDVEQKKYNLPDFLSERFVNGDVMAELQNVEPPLPGYKRSQEALLRYLDLARRDDGEQLPVPKRAVNPGKPYAGVPRLARFLRLVGDLPPEAVVDEISGIYSGALVEAVKRFQTRHGLTPDGRLGAHTLQALNTPLAHRVRQLQLTLERWRWVPHQFPQPPVVVNIPEFRLRLYNEDWTVARTMEVVVGKAYGHQTPVFSDEMEYVIFRPYWEVPPSIRRAEIVPAVRRDRGYLEEKGFELVDARGQVVGSGPVTDDLLKNLRAGRLEVRQKPGPGNSLGLVKLIFPNSYDVYLHGTPATELFSRARRDFSHGCIRVEDPAALAAWVLRNNPGWTPERVDEAMQSGEDNVRVNLAEKIPVLIVYGTAIAPAEGDVRFFEDIYGLDAALEEVLANGYPYPR